MTSAMRIISAISLCLAFSAVCWSTPLPDDGSVAASQASAEALTDSGPGGLTTATSAAESEAAAATGGNESSAEAGANSLAVSETQTNTLGSTSIPPFSTTPSAVSAAAADATTVTGSTSNGPGTSSGAGAGAAAQSGSGSSLGSAPSSSGSSGQCSYTDQELKELNVLEITDEDCQKLSKTWFVYQITTSDGIDSDAVACLDRYLDGNKCKCVKWEISQGDGCYVDKCWGSEGSVGTQLTYTESKWTRVTDTFAVFNVEVVNVESADANTLTATPAQQKDGIVQVLNQEVLLLGGDLDSFIVTQTGKGKDKIVAVSMIEELYTKDDSDQGKQQIIQAINQVLCDHNIDTQQLITLTETFVVDTNTIQTVSTQTTESPNGCQTTTTVCNGQDGDATMVTSTNTSGGAASQVVSNGSGSPPSGTSGSGSTAAANAAAGASSDGNSSVSLAESDAAAQSVTSSL